MSYHFLCKRGIRPARTEQFLVKIAILKAFDKAVHGGLLWLVWKAQGRGGLTDELCQGGMSSSSVGSVVDSAAVFVTPTRRGRYQWTYGRGLTLIDRSHLGSSIGVTGQGGRSRVQTALSGLGIGGHKAGWVQ